jgi:hypothetical protein
MVKLGSFVATTVGKTLSRSRQAGEAKRAYVGAHHLLFEGRWSHLRQREVKVHNLQKIVGQIYDCHLLNMTGRYVTKSHHDRVDGAVRL